MAERLVPRAITPMKQRLEAGCVPASISMVFSGFGVEVSEQTLVDRYFQTAALPDTDLKRGVTNTDTVKGIIQIIKDQGLDASLQLDVFIPSLYQHTKSPEERYIVEARPNAIRKYARIFEEESEPRQFFNALEQLLKKGEIGVYTANAGMMRLPKFTSFSMVPREAINGFYNELSDFIRKGHIVGPHGGLTAHIRALDGSRMEGITHRPEEKGYVIVDPRGESYAVTLHSLVNVDSMGVRGDIFDYLFRVSPRERELKPQTYGFRRFLRNLRDSIL